MVKFVTYKRVSTGKQGRSGLGLDAQQRDIELYLSTVREPYEIIAEYTEIESGAKNDRDLINEAIKVAKKEKAILLASKVDRLARSMLKLAEMVSDKKLDFRVAELPEVTDKAQIYMKGLFAEMERDMISKRTKDALRIAKERGVKLGAKNPQVAQANEAQKKQADDFAQKLWNGTLKAMHESGYSYSQMMRNLNELGVKSKTGRDFSVQAVKNIVLRMTA